jgi:predicted nucleotidyltransferase
MIDERTIAEAGRRLAEAAPGAEVILFGSWAREKDKDAGSDIDLLVIEPEVDNPAEEAVRLRRALRGLKAPIDVIVVGREVARRRAAVAGTVVERTMREGRVLVNA